jgi:hypothetical protein
MEETCYIDTIASKEVKIRLKYQLLVITLGTVMFLICLPIPLLYPGAGRLSIIPGIGAVAGVLVLISDIKLLQRLNNNSLTQADKSYLGMSLFSIRFTGVYPKWLHRKIQKEVCGISEPK